MKLKQKSAFNKFLRRRSLLSIFLFVALLYLIYSGVKILALAEFIIVRLDNIPDSVSVLSDDEDQASTTGTYYCEDGTGTVKINPWTWINDRACPNNQNTELIVETEGTVNTTNVQAYFDSISLATFDYYMITDFPGRYYCDGSKISAEVTYNEDACYEEAGGGCDFQLVFCDFGVWDSCQQCCVFAQGGPCQASPIVIDIAGNGFNLTNAAGGVHFDINGDGSTEQLSWTSANSDDAWLALDSNGNDRIDSGKELFGNFTNQPPPPAGVEKNGFLALAEYDKTANGGNDDGFITAQDAVFGNLRLWQDTNHNGVSEAGELKRLSSLGLAKMELDYKESKRTDEHGNRFKYRAKVKDDKGKQIGRWAWDVFLVLQPPEN